MKDQITTNHSGGIEKGPWLNPRLNRPERDEKLGDQICSPQALKTPRVNLTAVAFLVAPFFVKGDFLSCGVHLKRD